MQKIKREMFAKFSNCFNVQLWQGGSVMCDRTYGSDPAHPQFWHNCLPNEEQIEKHKNSSFFQKNWHMNEKIASKAKKLSGVKNDTLD